MAPTWTLRLQWLEEAGIGLAAQLVEEAFVEMAASLGETETSTIKSMNIHDLANAHCSQRLAQNIMRQSTNPILDLKGIQAKL